MINKIRCIMFDVYLFLYFKFIPEITEDVVKVILNLPKQEVDMAIRMAKEQGTTITGVIRSALFVYQHLSQLKDSQHRIFSETPDGKESKELFLIKE